MQENQPLTQPITPEEPKDLSPIVIILSLTTALFFILTVFFGIFSFTRKTVACPVCESSESKEEIIDDISSSLGFYPENITNPAKDSEYRVSVHRAGPDGHSAFGAFIGNDNESIEIYTYWQYVSEVYGLQTDRTDRETLLLSGLNTKVSDIIIAESGQTASGDVLLMLFQDGTIGYMPIKKALENHDIRSYGRLGGLENVAKFYSAVIVREDESSYSTTLAQLIDGSIIDLHDLLQSVVK